MIRSRKFRNLLGNKISYFLSARITLLFRTIFFNKARFVVHCRARRFLALLEIGLTELFSYLATRVAD